MDEGVRGSRTLSMNIKHEGDGWIGSKDKKVNFAQECRNWGCLGKSGE